MDFEVGQRVIRGSNGQSGFIHAVEKRRTLMLEIKWESSGTKQWLPASEVRAWDKLSEPIKTPPIDKRNRKQRTSEVLKLDAELRKARREYWEKKKVVGMYGDYLYSLSDERKNRTKMKAKKVFSKIKTQK